MFSRSIQEQQRWSRFNRNRNVVSIHMLRLIHSPPLSRRGAGLPSYWSVDPLSQFTSSFLPPIVNSVIPQSSVQLNSAIPQKLSHSKLWQCYSSWNSMSWIQQGNDLLSHHLRDALIKNLFFRNISLTGGPPPSLVTFRNSNVTFGQKKSGFQGQKQWPPKFHIKFRNTGHPPPHPPT